MARTACVAVLATLALADHPRARHDDVEARLQRVLADLGLGVGEDAERLLRTRRVALHVDAVGHQVDDEHVGVLAHELMAARCEQLLHA